MVYDTFVGRQPILDRDGETLGYELFFRAFDENKASIRDHSFATMNVATEGFVLAQKGLELDGKKFFINFTKELLINDAALALPSEFAVIEIDHILLSRPGVLKAVQELKKQNYEFAIDKLSFTDLDDTLFEIADYVKIDIRDTPRSELDPVMATIAGFDMKVIAAKVETEAEFKNYADLGVQYFQGYFFQKPEVVAGRKMSGAVASKLSLLNDIQQMRNNAPKLAEYIKRDASLSYRLLRYVNSPCFNFSHKISSIDQAVMLIGAKSTSHWLEMSVLSDVVPAKKVYELYKTSLVRAKFLESTANVLGLDPEKNFLLGLFSLLDAILGLPQAEVIGNLPLADEIALGFINKRTEYGKMLRLCEAVETQDKDTLLGLIKDLKLDPAHLSKSLKTSMHFAEANL
jgi:EAL and modified HD-GYP domain-containing signal transduction protein